MSRTNTLPAAGLAVAVALLHCVSPVDPLVQGTGGSETEARVIGHAIYADSTPVPGAFVYLRLPGNGAVNPTDTPTTVTDRAGRFVLESVESGSYLVEIIAVVDSETHAASHPFVITGSEQDGIKVLPYIVLTPAGSITGTIESLSSHPGVTVSLLLQYSGFLVGRTVADSAGAFVFGSLPAGTYSLTIVPSDTTFVRISHPFVRVEPGAATDPGALRLVSATSLNSHPAYIADSLVVRAILDSNQIDAPVATVVTVSPETFRVVELNLAHRAVSVLPDDIASLTALTSLDLRHNTLTRLPERIGRLSSLSKLLIDGNLLPSLPDSIGDLAALTTLSATGNLLQSLPGSIGRLGRLTRLHLDNNRIASLPAAVGSLALLELLVLDNNRLTELPPEICSLSRLRKLTVKGNNLWELPVALGAMVALRELLLDDNDLYFLPDSLANLVNLEMLWLGNNRLKMLPPGIGRCRSLLILDAAGNELNSLPDAVGDLARLATLDIADNRMGVLPASLVRCTAVTNLDLSGNRLCSLPAALAAWAAARDADWRATQQCGSDTTAPITLLSPNGNAVYMPGDTIIIAWQTSPTVTVDAVNLELTVDGGQTWVDLQPYPVTTNDDQWGRYPWAVREPLVTSTGAKLSIISKNCRIRITSYSEPEIFDVSDASFEIVERRTLTLTAPNGGEMFAPGDTLHVRWQADGVIAVACSLSVDSGRTWIGIIDMNGIYRSDPSRWGDAFWVVPDSVFVASRGVTVPSASTSCLAKVSDFIGCAYDDCYEDRSNGTFTMGGKNGMAQ